MCGARYKHREGRFLTSDNIFKERERERVKIIRTRRIFGPVTDFRLRVRRRNMVLCALSLHLSSK